MADVVGVGANSMDVVYLLPEYPQPDGPTSKLPIIAQRLSPGGQTATAMATCAALGRTASYVGAFGDDDHGARLRDELARRGVDVAHAVTRAAPNRYAVILIEAQRGERVVLWHRPPALTLAASELPHALLTTARVVHVDDEDEELALAAAHLARGAGVTVTSDLDRVTPRTAALIDAVTVPIFAAHVPEALTGERDPARALQALRQPHHTLLCVTLGAGGAMLLHGERAELVPGFAVDAVDTTGAGDVFRGAVIDGLLRGDPPRDIVRFANAAAAVACTRHGAMGGVPTRQDVGRQLAAGSGR